MDENKTCTTIDLTHSDQGSRNYPTPVWSAHRTRTLIRLWNSGRSTTDVAAALEITVRAVECKLQKLRAAGHAIATRRPSRVREPKKVPRKCLYCGGMFASTHVGNRLCPSCLEDGPFTGALL